MGTGKVEVTLNRSLRRRNMSRMMSSIADLMYIRGFKCLSFKREIMTSNIIVTRMSKP